MVRMVRMFRMDKVVMRKSVQWSEWTKWTQIQNEIIKKMCNGQNGQNRKSGHKFKIKL